MPPCFILSFVREKLFLPENIIVVDREWVTFAATKEISTAQEAMPATEWVVLCHVLLAAIRGCMTFDVFTNVLHCHSKRRERVLSLFEFCG